MGIPGEIPLLADKAAQPRRIYVSARKIGGLGLSAIIRTRGYPVIYYALGFSNSSSKSQTPTGWHVLRTSIPLSFRSLSDAVKSCSSASSTMLQILHRFQKPKGISSKRESRPVMGNRFIASSFATLFQSQPVAEKVMFDSWRSFSICLVSRSQICGCKLPLRRLSRQNALSRGMFIASAFEVRWSLMADCDGRLQQIESSISVGSRSIP